MKKKSMSRWTEKRFIIGDVNGTVILEWEQSDNMTPAQGNQPVSISTSNKEVILTTEDMGALLKTLKEYFAE